MECDIPPGIISKSARSHLLVIQVLMWRNDESLTEFVLFTDTFFSVRTSGVMHNHTIFYTCR